MKGDEMSVPVVGSCFCAKEKCFVKGLKNETPEQ